MNTNAARYIGLTTLSLAGMLAQLHAREASAGNHERRWSFFAYGGKWSDNSITQIVRLKTRMRNSWVWAAGVSRRVHEIAEGFLVEAEMNVARHTGFQNHFELNAAANLRWQRFPWNRYVKTSISYGLGPSYAFTKPPIEERPGRDHTHVHVFMPVEITLAPPERHNRSWAAVLRVHHRSGAFGVVNDATGSNFIAGGLRRYF